ncbi:MAG: hypothetical protein M0Q93_03460, partial [Terrimicrobiaceae bacterium]|nr:hypothetical protein [Terrimicrobiaceae bacterium]
SFARFHRQRHATNVPLAEAATMLNNGGAAQRRATTGIPACSPRQEPSRISRSGEKCKVAPLSTSARRVLC